MAIPFLEQMLKRVLGGGSLISSSNPLPTTPGQLGGTPVAKLGRYSGSDMDWQELVEWTVPTGKVGDLHEISWTSDNDAKTRMRLLIAGVDQGVPDAQIDSPLSLPWRENGLAAGSVVTLSVKSSDGTAINVSGSLTGTER
jgi:hypothetical protein